MARRAESFFLSAKSDDFRCSSQVPFLRAGIGLFRSFKVRELASLGAPMNHSFGRDFADGFIEPFSAVDRDTMNCDNVGAGRKRTFDYDLANADILPSHVDLTLIA